MKRGPTSRWDRMFVFIVIRNVFAAIATVNKMG
jgi:hypothetical protein